MKGPWLIVGVVATVIIVYMYLTLVTYAIGKII